MSELLNARAAAAYCGLSVSSIRAAVRRGALVPDGDHVYTKVTLDAWRKGARAKDARVAPVGLMTYAHAAALLNVRYEAIQDWIRRGVLEKVGAGFVRTADVESILAERELAGTLLGGTELARALGVARSAIVQAVADGLLIAAGQALVAGRMVPGYRLEDGLAWKAQRAHEPKPRKPAEVELDRPEVVEEKVAHLLNLEKVIKPWTRPRPTCRCPYPGCGGSVVSGEIEVGLWEHVCVLCAREVG